MERFRLREERRVVVTGLGVVTPVGNTVSEMWEAIVNGRSGAGRNTLMDVSSYDCQIAAEVKDFSPERFLPRKSIRHMPVASQYAVVASMQAIADSGLALERLDSTRVGVVIGTAGGSTIGETERAVRKLEAHRSARLSPKVGLIVWPNMPAFFIAEHYKLQGYNLTVCTACAAGTQAIGLAARVIQWGDADVVIAGGTEFILSHTVYSSFSALGGLSKGYNDKPQQAMRPFDADREGFIPGIGSAVLILEDSVHAIERGASILAEILGTGASNDAFNLIAPDPEGHGASLAMQSALADAGLKKDNVDYINAHGTSTPLGDVAETRAIKTVFQERAFQIPISSTKSMVGHMMGAAGAVEAVVCVLTLRDGVVHPTINYENPDPECDLDYVPNTARQVPVTYAISNSFGLGGQNACLALGRWRG